MKKLLLIIPLIIGCETEAVADVDALYNTYLCNVGTDAATGPLRFNDTSRPDSINVGWENVGFTGDLSYTEDDAVAECEVAYTDSTMGIGVDIGTDFIDNDGDGLIDGGEDSDEYYGNIVFRPLYCECEKSN